MASGGASRTRGAASWRGAQFGAALALAVAKCRPASWPSKARAACLRADAFRRAPRPNSRLALARRRWSSPSSDQIIAVRARLARKKNGHWGEISSGRTQLGPHSKCNSSHIISLQQAARERPFSPAQTDWWPVRLGLGLGLGLGLPSDRRSQPESTGPILVGSAKPVSSRSAAAPASCR